MLINRVATTPVDVPRGLAGVVVTDTSLGDVRGQEGFYHYRQYSAVELARTRDFEDVWHLMVHGELPDVARRTAFADRVRPLRRLPDDVQAALPAIATASARSSPLSVSVPPCRCSARPRASGRCTTSTRTAAGRTRWPRRRRCRPCSRRCTAWGRGWTRSSRGTTFRTPRTTCTC